MPLELRLSVQSHMEIMGTPLIPTYRVYAMSHIVRSSIFQLDSLGDLKLGASHRVMAGEKAVVGSEPDPCTQNRCHLGVGPPRDGGIGPIWVDSWFRRGNGKVLVDHPLPAHQVKCDNSLALRVGRHMWVKLYTPAGLNLSERHVRGYGRLGNRFCDHRQEQPDHKTWQVKCA